MAEPDTVSEKPRSEAVPEEPKSGIEGIIDAVADLLQTASDWVRQEAEGIVREKVVKPVQRLGLTLASASAAGCLLVFGLMFIAVGLFILLAEWLTYPGALLAIGGVYVLASLVFIVIKVRMMQK